MFWVKLEFFFIEPGNTVDKGASRGQEVDVLPAVEKDKVFVTKTHIQDLITTKSIIQDKSLRLFLFPTITRQ
jgi:hypothetical protein